jgi:glycosyltransferase involved in cell wall biosynthesis
MKEFCNILWWGRSSGDYSRNVVVREAMAEHGFRIIDFKPTCSRFGDIEASLKCVKTPDVVWVGCFRERDIAVASRWAHKRGIPVVFDPLISHYDKVVNEFQRHSQDSFSAKRILRQERRLFSMADVVIADTEEHAAYYNDVLDVPREKIKVVYVGADSHFKESKEARALGNALEVLFYGSFLPLQGPKIIVEAARLTAGHQIKWTLLGDGPEKASCVEAAKGLDNIVFRDPVSYKALPSVISGYDVLLGVFGVTKKAERVMPNKFFQAIASGRPVVTMKSAAYPRSIFDSNAVKFVPPGDARALADAVLHWNENRTSLSEASSAARALYEREFGPEVIKAQLSEVFSLLISAWRR